MVRLLAARSSIVLTLWTAEAIILSSVLLTARRNRSTPTSRVGCDTSANGFGRDTGTDFNIWFFDNHAALNGFPPSSAVLCSEHPLAIRLSESLNRDDTNAGLVVAAVTWTKADTPSCLLRIVRGRCIDYKRFVEITYSELHIPRLV